MDGCFVQVYYVQLNLECMNDSAAVTVVIMMVSGGEQGGFSSSPRSSQLF